MLEEDSLPILLALTLPMATPEDTYAVVRLGAAAQVLKRTAVALHHEPGFVAEVDDSGAALVPLTIDARDDSHGRAWAKAKVLKGGGDLIRELSRLKHGRDSDIVASEWRKDAHGLVADKALFQGDPRWVSEILARCPVPARFARRFIDRATAEHTIAFDVIDLLAPLLAEAADQVLSKSGKDLGSSPYRSTWSDA